MHHHHHHHHQSFDRRYRSPPPCQTLYPAFDKMSGMVMFVHSMVLSVQLLSCRPHIRTRSKVPSLLDSLHRLWCRVTWPNHISPHYLPMARGGGSMGPTRLSTLHHTYSCVMCSNERRSSKRLDSFLNIFATSVHASHQYSICGEHQISE